MILCWTIVHTASSVLRFWSGYDKVMAAVLFHENHSTNLILFRNQILSDQISSWKERNAEKLACREIDPSNERTMPVDVDGLVSDVERGLSRKLGHQRRRYQAVPVRAKMFLPQELKAMEMAKIRAALERSEWRRRVCILATKIVVLALLTFTAASIVIWKIFYQHQIEGNEP